jgi:hypothetical protein
MTVDIETLKHRVVRIARQQAHERAHYLKSGFGHKFNREGTRLDAMEGRLRAASFVVRGSAVPNVPDYVTYAARSQSESLGHRICAGRCGFYRDVAARAAAGLIGDPDSERHLRHPRHLLWLRPKNRAEAQERVYGECCIGYRHFDCAGFVDWCIWTVLSPVFPRGITYNVGGWRGERSHRFNWRSQGIEAGDILFADSADDVDTVPEDHIGIAVSSTEVAHAAGHEWGVQITPIRSSGMRGGNIVWADEARRLDSFLRTAMRQAEQRGVDLEAAADQ